jgi:hypothetical protein
MTTTLPALRTNRDRLLAQLDQRITLAQRKGLLVDVTA